MVLNDKPPTPARLPQWAALSYALGYVIGKAQWTTNEEWYAFYSSLQRKSE